MPVTVVPEGEEPAPAQVDTSPDGPQSPLALLRGKRSELDASLFKDLAVPRWEQLLGRVLWVRYAPADPNVFTTAMASREQRHKDALSKGGPGDPEWMTKANADLLASACIAVFDLAIGEEPPKGELPPGDYPTFASPELSEALDAPRSAVGTVLKAYGTSADVLLASTQLLNWSGQTSQEADKSFLGS